MAVMLAHRAADVWAVLRFALRFGLPKLQGACLAWLSGITKGRLLWHADTVVAVARQHAAACAAAVAPMPVPGRESGGQQVPVAPVAEAAAPGGVGGDGGGGAAPAIADAARRLPVVGMLEKDLLAEQQAAGLKQLSSYMAAAERLQLERLRDGLVRLVAGQWAALSRQPALVRVHREGGVLASSAGRMACLDSGCSPGTPGGMGGSAPTPAVACCSPGAQCATGRLNRTLWTPADPAAPLPRMQRPQVHALQAQLAPFMADAAKQAGYSVCGGSAAASGDGSKPFLDDVDSLFE